jgi:hypothetical protein
MMGSAGFEPATSAMSRRRHDQLDHGPIVLWGIRFLFFRFTAGSVGHLWHLHIRLHNHLKKTFIKGRGHYVDSTQI